MSAEAIPRPRHSASVPRVMIQPSRRPVTSSSASYRALTLIPTARSSPSTAMNERSGRDPKPWICSCHDVGEIGVEPQWSANVALRTDSSSSSRSSGHGTIDTPSTSTRGGRSVSGRRSSSNQRTGWKPKRANNRWSATRRSSASTWMRLGRSRSLDLSSSVAWPTAHVHQLPPDALSPVGGRHRAADEAALVHGLRREVRRGDHADHGIAGDGDHRVGRHRRVLVRQVFGELGRLDDLRRCRPPGCRR